MSILTTADKISAGFARYTEKPLLAVIAPQWIMRGLFAATAPLMQRLPAGCRVEDDEDGGLMLVPQNTDNEGLLLYVHGGGFTMGSPRTHRAMAAHIGAAAGLRVHLPRYPLAPKHPFPSAIDTLKAVYAGHVARGDTPVAIGGDSAGGNLALLTVQHARDAGLPLPKAMLMLSPVVDLGRDIAAEITRAPSEFLIPAAWARRIKTAYIPTGIDPADPAISPIHGDLSGLPPTLLHVAKGEALADQCATLAARLPDCRMDVWPGLQHVWHLKAGVTPAATLACAELGAFVRAHS